MKTRIPNHSSNMNILIAGKVDTLKRWGVLTEPEKLGINVEFVSPSLLIPELEQSEYRVVTDFTALDVHLKKVPNTTATLAQEKARIARYPSDTF